MSTSTRRERASRLRHVTAVTLAVAVVFALVVRGPTLIVGIGLLFLIFVPLERLLAVRPQKVFRRGLATDLTHLLVNNTLVTVATVVFVVAVALPLLWVRRLAPVSALPPWAAIVLAVVLVFVGNYWGHRLTHQVPFLWRFHAVHHSIEEMDFAAAGRLHPLDSAFTQAFTVLPLFVLGYRGGVFAGVTLFVVLLAIFQHANVRLRFPIVRWMINTPEWHHWHHSRDPEARDKNFGLPAVDWVFGTAYLPKHRRPSAFGTESPVPSDGYLRHLAYPFTKAARSGTSLTT